MPRLQVDTIDMPTQRIDPYEALACGVIKQAINDVIFYKHNKSNNKYNRRSAKYDYDTAMAFMETEKLDNFLNLFQMNLKPDYVRAKFHEVTK